jgi:protein phosphatase
MTYANVGDSRIYLVHGGAIRQLTRDDSWVNLVPGSDTAAMKNVLTKALGAREEVDFDVVTTALTPGDVLLLCSDGLTNMLSDDDILRGVLAYPGDLGAACRHLVDAANEEGGRDNISVLLVRYER